MAHGTAVGELWFAPGARTPDNNLGGGPAVIPHAANWRGRRTVTALLERGEDPLALLVARAHRHRMTLYTSLRLAANNLPAPKGGAPPRPPSTERGSPSGSAGEFLDFSSAAARAERLALLAEVLDAYGVDGLDSHGRLS
jgi:hypothetical protein